MILRLPERFQEIAVHASSWLSLSRGKGVSPRVRYEITPQRPYCLDGQHREGLRPLLIIKGNAGRREGPV